MAISDPAEGSVPMGDVTGSLRAALERGELILPRCDVCGRHHWYPRPRCPHCGSHQVRWRTAAGTGTVYARTIVRRGAPKSAGPDPYTLAVVELAEGPRMLTRIVGPGSEEVAIGAAVRLDVRADAHGNLVPHFATAKG